MSKIKVGLVQQAFTKDREEHLRRIEQHVRTAASAGAGLVILQELHNGPYFCQVESDDYFDTAESIPGPSTERFGRLAKELGIVLVISLFEKRTHGIYHNTAVVLEKDGSIAGTYRKSHIPDDPRFYEKYYFTPGDTGIEPIKTSVGTLGVLVCWDQWYPEAARLMALRGAEMLIYPTAIGWHPAAPAEENQRQHGAWETIQRGHAVANGIPVLVVNRTGFEPDPSSEKGEGIQFWGQSFVAGCQGEIIAKAPADQEHVIITEIDLDRIDKVRRNWPFFRDRRIDAYGDLLKRYIG